MHIFSLPFMAVLLIPLLYHFIVASTHEFRISPKNAVKRLPLMLGNLLLGLPLAILLIASITFLGFIHLPVYILQALFKAKKDPKFLKKILLTYPLIFTATFFLFQSISYAVLAIGIALLIKSTATISSYAILPAQIISPPKGSPQSPEFIKTGLLRNPLLPLLIATNIFMVHLAFHSLACTIILGLISIGYLTALFKVRNSKYNDILKNIMTTMGLTTNAARLQPLKNQSLKLSGQPSNKIFMGDNASPYAKPEAFHAASDAISVLHPNVTSLDTPCSEVAATLEDCLQAFKTARSNLSTAEKSFTEDNTCAQPKEPITRAYGTSLGGMIITMAESDLPVDQQCTLQTNCSPINLPLVISDALVKLPPLDLGKQAHDFTVCDYSSLLCWTFNSLFVPFLWLCGWHRNLASHIFSLSKQTTMKQDNRFFASAKDEVVRFPHAALWNKRLDEGTKYLCDGHHVAIDSPSSPSA